MQGGMGAVAGAALQVTQQMQSLEAAQRLCDQMLAIPSPGGSFFQAAISMELAATPQSISRVQRLFEVNFPCSLIAQIVSAFVHRGNQLFWNKAQRAPCMYFGLIHSYGFQAVL